MQNLHSKNNHNNIQAQQFIDITSCRRWVATKQINDYDVHKKTIFDHHDNPIDSSIEYVKWWMNLSNILFEQIALMTFFKLNRNIFILPLALY